MNENWICPSCGRFIDGMHDCSVCNDTEVDEGAYMDDDMDDDKDQDN